MEGDYGYANARIRAMKSRLLEARVYEDLLTALSLDDIIKSLARTAYKPQIEAALVKYAGLRCIAEALRNNIAATVGELKTFFSGRPRELLARLLARWDIFNLMTILRGQVRGVSGDEILDILVPAGELTEVELFELAQQPNIRATADVMLTWHLPYARPLARALRAGGNGDLLHLETQLNQLRYQDALRDLGEDTNDALIREMLQAEIDVVNIITLLRLCRVHDRASQLQTRYGASNAMPFLIVGGGMHPHVLEELSAAPDVEAVVHSLQGTVYAAILSKQVELYRQGSDLGMLQRELEVFLVHKGIAMFRRDPLSIAIAIGYITAKTNEVTNVRLLAQGKALGSEREVIERDMIQL